METQAADNTGKIFPEVTGESLAGNQVTIPDAAKGNVTLIAMAFLRENQGQLDSWLNPFVEKFGDKKGYMFYEVPMISTGYKFMKFVIDGGMRGGIPAFKHKHVVTMYGNVEKYISALNLDPRNGYAFLLDKEGKIRWQGQGFASKDDLNTFMREAEKLAR